jgi:hypothetical protein
MYESLDIFNDNAADSNNRITGTAGAQLKELYDQ